MALFFLVIAVSLIVLSIATAAMFYLNRAVDKAER